MQRGGGRWVGEGAPHHQAPPTEASSKPPSLSEILRLPLSPQSALYSSSQFVRYSADGKEASLVSARIDTCGHILRVSSKEGESLVDVRKLRLVVGGNKPKDSSKIKKLLGAEQVGKDQSLSIYWGEWPWRELNLVAISENSARIWKRELKTIVDNLPHSEESWIDYWLQCMYVELARQSGGGQVHALTALSHFGGVRLWRAYSVLENLLSGNPALKERVNQEMQDLSFSVFQALFFTHTSTQRPDIQKIYSSYATAAASPSPSGVICVSKNKTASETQQAATTSKRRSSLAIMSFRSKNSSSSQQKPAAVSQPPTTKQSEKSATMSDEAFLKFLKDSQGRNDLTHEQVVEMIKKYDLVCDSNNKDSISLSGFTHFMLSQEAAPSSPKRGAITHSMSQPLSSYFIASSHNTYLNGHQFNGDSSVNMYALVLASGCRCVELDCWDGEDDDPIIYHGHTFTSKIKFKDVVETIAEYAFSASPYPLILSLENHCSISQQMKMAEYMKRAFGEMLLSDYIDPDPHRQQLPSPEELKYKILIKNRKIGTTSSTSEPRTASSVGSGSVIASSDSTKVDPSHQRRRSLIGFGSPSSPSGSGKGKLFSRISSAPSSPTSINGSTTLSPTEPHPPLLSPSVNASFSFATDIIAGSRNNCPTIMKLAAATHKLPLTRQLDHSDQRESTSIKPGRLMEEVEEAGVRESTVSMRSPTSRLPPSSSSMDTIMEEEGCVSGSKISITNELDDNGEAVSSSISTIAPRSNAWSDSGSNALSSGSDNSEIITENDANSRESETDFNTSNLEPLPSSRENGDRVYPRSPCPTRRRRIVLEASEDEETILAAAMLRPAKEPVLSELTHPRRCEDELGKRASSVGEKSSCGWPKSSSQPYARSLSLPVERPNRSQRMKEREMTKTQHKPLTRTASVPNLDLMAIEEILDKESEWMNYNTQESGESLKQSDPNKHRVRKTGCIPPHIQREVHEHVQKVSARPQSPLVLHQLKSPQRRPVLLAVSQAEACLINLSTKSSSPEKKALTYSRSVSETKEDREKSRDLDLHRENSNPFPARTLTFSPEKDDSSNKPIYSRRRCSVGVLQPLAQSSLGSVAKEMREDVTAGDDLCTDTAEASYKHKCIAKDISDMVYYTEPVKFTGFKRGGGANLNCTQMFSMSENAAKKALKKTPLEFLSFNERHLSRVYPSATRLNSSNFDPGSFWMLGCQMVALNYQTNDTPMQQYMSVFSQNGGCGYLLKSPILGRDCENYLRGEQLLSSDLTITMVSAQNILQGEYLPTVEIEVLGAPYDCSKFHSTANHKTGSCSLWDTNNVMNVKVILKEMAAVKFSVFSRAERGQDNLVFSCVLPLSAIKTGYQHVYLSDDVRITSPPPSLFIHAILKDCEVREEVMEREDEPHSVESETSPPQEDKRGRSKQVAMVTVKVAVDEVEPHHVQVPYNQGMTAEDLVSALVEQVGLGGASSAYSLSLLCEDDFTTFEAGEVISEEVKGELQLEDMPTSTLPQLATVPIHYTDLEGVEHESITLFADIATTAGDLLFGAVNRLGEDIHEVCPTLKDREDEEEIQKLFCFVLADELERDGIISYHAQQLLDLNDLVLPMFTSPSATVCLMLHTVEQDHGLVGVANDEVGVASKTEKVEESELVSAANERRIWRQQDTVIIYDRETGSEDVVDFEEEESVIGAYDSGSLGTPKTSVKIKPIAPEVAKQFLEDYYNKLRLKIEKRLGDELGRGTRRGKLSKSKRRCVSFNQPELQRHKLKGSGEVRETRTHIRRMSVDVGLFLGQKGLQAKAGSKSPVELSPVRGGSGKEGEGVRSSTTSIEKDKVEIREESKSEKQGSVKKKGSRRLRRALRLGSTEEEEGGVESSTQVSQIPLPRARQGKFRTSLRNKSSDDVNSLESGSTTLTAERAREVEGGGRRMEKKSKLASSFPQRQWSWRSKKTEFESTLCSLDHPSHQRSSSDVGEERLLSSTSASKEECAISLNPKDKEFPSPTSTLCVVDSWECPAPSRGFTKHTSL